MYFGDVQYVKEDKVETESPCFDPEDLGAGGEVVDHTSENHIDVGVDP